MVQRVWVLALTAGGFSLISQALGSCPRLARHESAIIPYTAVAAVERTRHIEGSQGQSLTSTLWKKSVKPFLVVSSSRGSGFWFETRSANRGVPQCFVWRVWRVTARRHSNVSTVPSVLAVDAF